VLCGTNLSPCVVLFAVDLSTPSQSDWEREGLKGHFQRIIRGRPVDLDCSSAAVPESKSKFEILKNSQKFLNQNFEILFHSFVRTAVQKMCAKFRENRKNCRRSSDLKNVGRHTSIHPSIHPDINQICYRYKLHWLRAAEELNALDYTTVYSTNCKQTSSANHDILTPLLYCRVHCRVLPPPCQYQLR